MDDGELIDQVRSYPLLYDKRNRFYKDTTAIKNAETIAIVMESTADECQRRWSILRARYNAERKKYIPSGTQGDIPTWVYFEAMSFLSDYVVQRRSRGNMSALSKSSTSWDPLSIIIDEEDDAPENCELQSPSSVSSGRSSTAIKFQSVPVPIVENVSQHTPRQKCDDGVVKTMNRAMSTLNSYMESKTNDHTSENEADRDMCFGRMVGLGLKERKDENEKKK